MLIKFVLFTSVVASFLYFASPDSYKFISSGDVLGIENRAASFNRKILDSMLLAYCVNKGTPPGKLNDLYDGYFCSHQ